MAGQKPTAATVLSIIGGIFILLGGVAMFALAGFVALFPDLIPGLGSLEIDPVLLLNIIGGLGVVIGLVIVAGGFLMYSRPRSSTSWGVLILILSIVIFFVPPFGFFLGFILGLVGGILGIVFKPTAPAAPVEAPPPAAPAPEPASEPEGPSTESGEQ